MDLEGMEGILQVERGKQGALGGLHTLAEVEPLQQGVVGVQGRSPMVLRVQDTREGLQRLLV